MQTERRDCKASALHASEALALRRSLVDYYQYDKPYLALNSQHQ